MVFVVRILTVVVTAGKGRRRNECSFKNDITQFLLTFVEPYEKRKQKQNNQFLAAVVQEGDAKENLTESCSGRWSERNLFRAIF